MTDKIITVFDVETTIRNTEVGNFKASPFYKNNKIVAIGYTFFASFLVDDLSLIPMDFVNKRDVYSHYIDEASSAEEEWKIIKRMLNGTDILVGHNLGFDLHYIRRYAPSDEEWMEHTKDMVFFDTMIGAFILSSQTHRFPSLDDLSAALSLPVKDKTIAELWNSGVQTEDIDRDLLINYLDNDVRNTAAIFLHQMKALSRNEQLPHAFMEMEAFRVTNEMEWNGIAVNMEELRTQKSEAEMKVHLLANDCLSTAMKLCRLKGLAVPVLNNYSANSDMINSALLFGGVVKYTVEELVFGSEGMPEVYKTGSRKGMAKTRNAKKEINIPPSFPIALIEKVSTQNKDGYWSVDRKTLDALVQVYVTKTYTPDPDSIVGASLNLVELLISYREWNKILGTYLLNIESNTWPDGMVHHSLNHCVAITGRLSSSNPNLQNQSN